MSGLHCGGPLPPSVPCSAAARSCAASHAIVRGSVDGAAHNPAVEATSTGWPHRASCSFFALCGQPVAAPHLYVRFRRARKAQYAGEPGAEMHQYRRCASRLFPHRSIRHPCAVERLLRRFKALRACCCCVDCTLNSGQAHRGVSVLRRPPNGCATSEAVNVPQACTQLSVLRP
jgi:hypothetical protein